MPAGPTSIEFWRTILAGEALPTAAGYASLRPVWAVALSIAALGSGAAFARLAALRAGERRVVFAVRALLGGAAAFGLARLAFEAVRLLGLDPSWERLTRGDAAALLLAAVIGLVEEGAKLAGVLLAVQRGVRARAAIATAFGVAAAFAALEAILSLAGDRSTSAFARAALGPIAHGLLLVPAALAVSPALRSRRPALALLVPLGASAALHAVGDLSVALSSGYPVGYAVALGGPALVLFTRGRRTRARAFDREAPGGVETSAG